MKPYECTTCNQPGDLDLAGEKARSHRTRKNGPWCEGGGRDKAQLKKIEG